MRQSSPSVWGSLSDDLPEAFDISVCHKDPVGPIVDIVAASPATMWVHDFPSGLQCWETSLAMAVELWVYVTPVPLNGGLFTV